MPLDEEHVESVKRKREFDQTVADLLRKKIDEMNQDLAIADREALVETVKDKINERIKGIRQ
jgi:hypothetical protein